MERVAIFPGTFDPFTIGHKDIVVRALPMFDKIIISLGDNQDKNPLFPLEQRVERIKKAFEGNSKIEVLSYAGLTIDFARKVGASFILRGIRNALDFEYEKQLALANKEIGGIETVLLTANPAHEYISSSVVRDLYKNGRDISDLIV